MTENAEFRFFQNDVLLREATNSIVEGSESYRYSGRTDIDLVADALDVDYASWIAVASRSGEVSVTITYAGGTETFPVEPGMPLLTLTTESDAPPDVTISPVDGSADVEVLIYASTVPLQPSAPAFLILNAGTGVTEDDYEPGVIDSWEDTRAVSLAPDPFDWTGASSTRPTLIASDPDFNGQPSVDFSGAGDAEFYYSVIDGRFGFLSSAANYSSDFTVMSIMSVPDDAEDNTAWQGLWGVANSDLADSGFSVLVDPAYRMYNAIPAAPQEDLNTEEFSEKPMVAIWEWTLATGTLRVYWQGRWQAAVVLSTGNLGGQPYPLKVGSAIRPNYDEEYLRGKIADFRVYNRLLTPAEKDAYIAMAVSDYGVDDTEEQGFPYLADSYSFVRANRGNNTSGSKWSDTRPEVASTVVDWLLSGAGGSSPPSPVVKPLLNDKHAYEMDGTGQYMLGMNTTGGSIFGGVAPGFTASFVYYKEDTATYPALFSQSNYSVGTLEGMNIWFNNPNGSLRYEVDNSADADVIFTTGEPSAIRIPRLVVIRTDGVDYWVDETDLVTGVTSSITGTLAGVPSNPASAPVYICTWPNFISFAKCRIAEMGFVASKVTDANLALLKTYAINRYGTG